MTLKSWYKWQSNIHKTISIECKDRTIFIYKDDRLLGYFFNGDDSVELLIERDSIYLEGFHVRHQKTKQKYAIKRENIIKIKYN